MGFGSYGNCYSALSVALSMKLKCWIVSLDEWQAEGNFAEALLIWLYVDSVLMRVNSRRLYCAETNTCWGGVKKTSSLIPIFWDLDQREQKSSLTSENKILLSGFFSSFFPLAFASVQLACELILPSPWVKTTTVIICVGQEGFAVGSHWTESPN